MRILDGLKGSLVIDDSYNASPVAVTEALNVLRELPVKGRRILVLGDMLELGEYANNAHKEAGRHAAQVCDVIYGVGQFARTIADGARQAGMRDDVVYAFDDTHGVADHLGTYLSAGDVVLVKGSQAVRCEQIVEGIMVRPQDAPELLVRQSKDWMQR